MPIFVGDHQFVSVGELTVGRRDIQEVYFGAQKIWPAGAVDGGYILAEQGCKLLLEDGDFLLLESGQPAPIASPEAQPVLDRMCALDSVEETALINFVDGLVADGLWDSVLDVYALGFNQYDFLTSWKDSVVGTLTPGGAPLPSPLHAQRRTLFATGAYYRADATFDQIFTGPCSGFLVYNDGWTQVDGNFPTHLFGGIDAAVNAYECIWRGRAFRDYLVQLGASSNMPTPPDSTIETSRFGENLNNPLQESQGPIGAWTDQSKDVVLTRLGEQLSAARTPGVTPAVRFQSPGTNNNEAGPALGEANIYVSMWLFINAPTFTVNDCEAIRQRMLQFARDLGLNNVPSS